MLFVSVDTILSKTRSRLHLTSGTKMFWFMGLSLSLRANDKRLPTSTPMTSDYASQKLGKPKYSQYLKSHPVVVSFIDAF